MLALLTLTACGGPTVVTRREGVERINSVYPILWERESAEYPGLCHQTFNAAFQYVSEIMKGEALTRPKRPAVVMDVDETVLSNSDADLARGLFNDRNSKALWAAWLEHSRLSPAAVPGAVDFIAKVRNLGVEVYFVTDRGEEEFDATVTALYVVGALAQSPTVSDYSQFVRMKTGKDDTKQKRMAKLLIEEISTLAYIGDSIGDFPYDFVELTPAARRDAASESSLLRVRARWKSDAELLPLVASLEVSPAEKWGRGWFLLPNPVYGRWRDDILSGDADADVVSPWMPMN